MKKFLVLCFSLFIMFSIIYAEDEGFLLDDFTDGNDRNKLDLYWFYYSDVNDSGNSQILNAEYLGNGAYSRVEPVLIDSQSMDYCAKLEFQIGDLFPCQKEGRGKCGDRYEGAPQFVGIGTDLSLTKDGIDISEFDSISFDFLIGQSKVILKIDTITISDTIYKKGVGEDTILIINRKTEKAVFVDGIDTLEDGNIVFNIISDYGMKEDWEEKDKNNFYHTEIIPTKEYLRTAGRWYHVTIRKEDLELYLWGRERIKINDLTNYLKTSYKLTWSIFGGGEEYYFTNGDKGIFYLDNIRIYPSSIFQSPLKNYRIVSSEQVPQQNTFFPYPTLFYDFLGRKMVVNGEQKIGNLPIIFQQKSYKKVLRLK